MTSTQLQADISALVDAIEFVGKFAPNAVSSEMAAFLQKVESDSNLLNVFVHGPVYTCRVVNCLL